MENHRHSSLSKPRKSNRPTIYEHLPVGIVEVANDGRFLSANPEFCRLLGYEKQELLLLGIEDVTYHEDYEAEIQLFNRLITGKIPLYRLEKRFVCKDGQIVWTELTRSISPARRGKAAHTIAVAMDITARRRAEGILAGLIRQQHVLYRLADQLNHTTSLDDVFNAALGAILRALQCERASILLFDETNFMHFVAWRGLSDGYRRVTDGHSPWKVGEKQPVPICMNDIKTADLSDSLKVVIEQEGIQALAFIPLVSNGKLIGKFMIYFNTPHVFTEADVELSLAIARQLASAIERMRAEEALRESEARFRALLNQATAGIVRKKLDGTLLFVNEAFCNMLGYSAEELVGKSIWQFTHQVDLGKNRESYDHLMRDGLPFQLEKRLIRRDGSVVWVNASVSPVMDMEDKPQYAVAVEVDITERKQAEETLQQLNSQLESLVEKRTSELRFANQALQKNRRRLVEVQEEERRALARELHDRVGQSLTALNLNLSIIQQQLSKELLEKVGGRLADSINLLDETIPAVRDVMSNLRPAVLDEYGLEAALRFSLSEFTSRYGIQIDFPDLSQSLPRLDTTAEMMLLRIAQEALFNIAKHSQATHAKLFLALDDKMVCMTIEDNGIGFEALNGGNHPDSHGLNIMRERAEAVGGTFNIASKPGHGTRLEVTIPLPLGSDSGQK